MEPKLLKRSLTNKWLGGVCSGLGKYFGVDPLAWRLIFIFGTFFTIFPFICAYIILWVVVPKEEI
jgi:phage shock protein C